MKKIYVLIFCGLFYSLFSMDDTNIFEIDSDELRELKEIAKTIESPTQTAQQEQKIAYQQQSEPSPQPLALPTPPPPQPENKTQPKKTKELIPYTCICGCVYYVEGWLLNHQKKCAIVKVHRQPFQ